MWVFTRGDLPPVLESRAPSAALLISKRPAAPFTPFTRRLDRNAPALRSATNCATAARNTACWSAESASKSAPKRANQAKVARFISERVAAALELLPDSPSRKELLSGAEDFQTIAGYISIAPANIWELVGNDVGTGKASTRVFKRRRHSESEPPEGLAVRRGVSPPP